ncbi:MAG: hypothetical protein NTX32_04325 [Candidatus Firestonebacteria bacterium]|nr:hypothetical protein [Candidatus Firestonebacteria bacterium]
MAGYVKMNENAHSIMKEGGVWVPCPLPLDVKKEVVVDDLRLLMMYYIKSGAGCVVPGAHTGEFCGYGILPEKKHYELYEYWLKLVKSMVKIHGNRMLLMSMVHNMKHVEMSAKHGYDVVIFSPKFFKGIEGNTKKMISVCKDMASVIPIFGFHLQTKAGGIDYHYEFWEELFKIAYGAKLAPFDRYRTLTAMEAAAASKNRKNLTIVSGNDDHIVGDLMRNYTFKGNTVTMDGGLLGHYATDTHAAVKWTQAVRDYKAGKKNWPFKFSVTEVLDAVTACNMVLFDAYPNNFKNSTWAVKYRLSYLGLIKSPYCFEYKGDNKIKNVVNARYDNEYKSVVSDKEFVRKNIDSWKKEAGLK